MADGFLARTYRKYNGIYPLFNGNTPATPTFVGTVTIENATATYSVATQTGYDIVAEYGSQYGRFRVDGTGTFKARMLLVGGGGDGGVGNNGVSGAGGAGGTFNYYVDYEFQAGVQYSLQVYNTISQSGNVVVAINPDSFPNPPYQELIVITPGGGATGPSGVSGLSDGATGSIGTLSNITGVTVSYGGAGGSGASIPASGFGVARSQVGGKGNNFYNSIDSGNGGDASRFSNDTIDQVTAGNTGAGNTGNGGGGGATVWARASAFPNAFQWFNGGKGYGGEGTIIIRYSVT
jgi:hypothetical protein